MTLQYKAILGFFFIAFFLEMYACTLSVAWFLGISAILAIIGSALYLGWAWSLRAEDDYLPTADTLFPAQDYTTNFSEVFIPGSAAQQIYLLRQEEANRVR
jgi:hypothetical protein